jgi:uncharacterized cofD-like protein
LKIIDGDTKVVVIGGGTGSFTVLSGLKNYYRYITAIVSMADDGGSTGQLRDDLGVLPPGDVRQCLVALSRSPRVRDLFSYRFEEGSFKGHSFGNLFLTALEKMTGDFYKGVALAGDILRTSGRVEPVTFDKVVLAMQDGKKVLAGQHEIDIKQFAEQRPEIWLEPRPTANPRAIEAIKKADIVVVAPGGLYTSLGATLVVPGVGQALKRSKARKIYICNLVNKPGQTDGFTVADYAAEIERTAGVGFLDIVLYNTHRPSREMLARYAADGELPVKMDKVALRNARFKVVGVDLLAREVWQGGSKSDTIASTRTLIRHDPNKIARQIVKLTSRKT